MEVTPSAGKHGIGVDDARHAARHALRVVPQDEHDPYRVLVIGVDRAGRLLEVVVLEPETAPRIIHAMLLRASFYRYLD
ncbi:hypothetical protein GCM10027586_02990 [Kineococcus gypseus]|uniref:hypothetical protein n=1 Tax=Kineococcus gypseus TaxID=1637102 RepID=UPI003D7D23FD